MFRSNSRYFKLPALTVSDPNGRDVSAVKLRVTPRTTGQPTMVRSGDQLDVMSERRYGDATLYWRIADANNEFEANGLVTENGRIISVPED